MTNTMHPLVTIAIPTYNRARTYLRQALESAVRQTYKNIEIIVANNCSTDDTEMVVNDFNDRRIKYFRHNENIGSNNNQNFCLEQANGLFSLLLYDDDLIDNDFVEVCIDAMNGNHSIGLVVTGAREIDAEGNITSQCPNPGKELSTGEFFLNWFAGKIPLYSCNVLMNTKSLREIGGLRSKTNTYEDVVADAQLMGKYGRVDVYDVKASFRRHGDHWGSSLSISDWWEDSLYLLDIICNLASERKTFIRSEGMKYFSKKSCHRSYMRAARIKSPLSRFLTYLSVYKTFNYQYLPPPLERIKSIIYSNNFLFSWLRSLRRRL